MKWYLLMGLTILSLSGCNSASQDGTHDRQNRHNKRGSCDDRSSMTDDSWHGPGYYNGVWIQSEAEYNDWYYNNNAPTPRSRSNQMKNGQYRNQ